MHKFLHCIYRIVLLILGFFVLFDLQFVVQELFAKSHDVMGTSGLWIRPFYYVILRFAPFLVVPALISDVFTAQFWINVILCLFLPVLAVVLFERSRVHKSLWKVGLFYFFVPTILFLASSYAVEFVLIYVFHV